MHTTMLRLTVLAATLAFMTASGIAGVSADDVHPGTRVLPGLDHFEAMHYANPRLTPTSDGLLIAGIHLDDPFGTVGEGIWIKLGQNGRRDTRFGDRGILRWPGRGSALSVAELPNGTIRALIRPVTQAEPFVLATLTSEGTPLSTQPFGPIEPERRGDAGASLDGEGAIMWQPAEGGVEIRRYTLDGNPDTGFGTNGIVVVPTGVPPELAAIYGVATSPQRIALGATASPDHRVQLTMMDRTGNVVFMTPISDELHYLRIVGDATYVVTHTNVTRLDADGSPDPSFGEAGVLESGAAGEESSRFAVADNGSVLVATGSSGNGWPIGRITFRKFTSSGTPDATFAAGEAVTLNATLPERLTLAADGTAWWVDTTFFLGTASYWQMSASGQVAPPLEPEPLPPATTTTTEPAPGTLPATGPAPSPLPTLTAVVILVLLGATLLAVTRRSRHRA